MNHWSSGSACPGQAVRLPAAHCQGPGASKAPLPLPGQMEWEALPQAVTLNVELWVGEQLRPVALSTPSRSHLENVRAILGPVTAKSPIG